MSRIVSLGDLVLDLICSVKLPIEPARHQEAPPVRPEPGGGCNFIIAARRLGTDVSAVGAVGADIFGGLLMDVLKDEGVDISGVFVAPNSSSAVVLDLIDRQTHQHVFVGNLAAGDSAPYTAEVDAIIQSAGAVFLQGYTLLEVQLPALVERAVMRARELRIPVYFDVGPTTAHADRARLHQTLTQVDVIMSTEDEIPLAADGKDGDDAYAHLFALGVSTIVVKRGPAGCAVITRDGRFDVPGFAVEVVDTVGAGDCFNAAFIHARLHGKSLEEAATLANATGAACVRKVAAGRNAPTRLEIASILNGAGIHMEF